MPSFSVTGKGSFALMLDQIFVPGKQYLASRYLIVIVDVASLEILPISYLFNQHMTK